MDFLKKLGIDTSFIGRLGNDDVAKYLKGSSNILNNSFKCKI